MHLNVGRFPVALLQQWYLLLLAPSQSRCGPRVAGSLFILSLQLSLAHRDCLIPHAGAIARAFGSNLLTDVVTFVDTLQVLKAASCGCWVLHYFYSFYIFIYVILPCLGFSLFRRCLHHCSLTLSSRN